MGNTFKFMYPSMDKLNEMVKTLVKGGKDVNEAIKLVSETFLVDGETLKQSLEIKE